MKKFLERFVRGEEPRKRVVTVEIVATVEIDADAPNILMMVDHNKVEIPLKLAPTSPTNPSEDLDVDVLTVQWRINEGRAYLHKEPHRMPTAPTPPTPPSGRGGGSRTGSRGPG